MYKAYLADDESYVREGLKKHFDWERYGVTLVGEAADGEKAWQDLQASPADILITDVKMPGMDGIELAQRARALYPKIKILFISGYGDLDYLKSSLKLGAVDYIMKSIDLDELGQTLQRVTKMIDEEKKWEDLLNQMEKKVQQSMPLLRERFLTRLVKDDIPPKVQKQMDFLGLPLKEEDHFCVLIASVENFFDVYGEKGEHDRQLLSFAILNIFQEVVDRYFSGCAFETRMGEYTAILSLPAGEEFESGLLKLANEVRQMLSRSLSVFVSLGISQIVKGIGELKNAYAGTVRSIGQRNYLGGNKNVILAPYQLNRPESFPGRSRLTQSMLAGQAQKVQEQLAEIFGQLSGSEPGRAKDILFQLVQLPYLEFSEYQGFLEAEYAGQRLVCERFFCCRALKDMQQLVRQVYAAFCRAVQQRRETPLGSAVQKVKEFIRNRYAENLTIAEIAESVYLTPTYVCLLFKQETGLTVNDYLTRVRIDKAKELLRGSEKKLYDVCLSVGYASPSYFSRLFKKLVGCTPSEYRDMTASIS